MLSYLTPKKHYFYQHLINQHHESLRGVEDDSSRFTLFSNPGLEFKSLNEKQSTYVIDIEDSELRAGLCLTPLLEDQELKESDPTSNKKIILAQELWIKENSFELNTIEMKLKLFELLIAAIGFGLSHGYSHIALKVNCYLEDVLKEYDCPVDWLSSCALSEEDPINCLVEISEDSWEFFDTVFHSISLELGE